MSFFVWTRPLARKRHVCSMCWRVITPGEFYDRMCGMDGGTAWTNKECEHCHRCAIGYLIDSSDYEYDPEDVREWLHDYEPMVWSQLLAGWRTPEGDLLPPPFEGQKVFA